MNWMFFTFLAIGLYTCVNFVDKYVVRQAIADYRGMPIYSAIASIVVGAVLWVGAGYPVVGLRDSVILLLTGMFQVWGVVLYFKAISEEEVSTIIVFNSLIPLISLALSYSLLGEVITLRQLAGFLVILCSIMAVSVQRDALGFRLSRAFWYLVIANAVWAVNGVLFKFVSNAHSFSKVISYESFGFALGGLVLYLGVPSIRRAFNATVQTGGRRTFRLVFLNEVLYVLAKCVNYLAYSLGPIALVSVLGGTQVFLAVLTGWILTSIAPAIFREDITRSGLARKAVFGMTLFAGIWLVS